MITLSHLKGAARHAALVVAALLPLWASAQTLTLSVPYRGATSMQTASTTIEFDASAIAAGATINVAGIPMPVAGAACVGLLCNSINATAAGDDILVRRVSGTNRAQLELSYTSTFNAVTHSLCDYKGPTDAANPRQYSLILTGFTFGVGTNGFRITSFMAPSDISCDKAYLRVAGGARPTLSGGGLIKRGRLPLNIVLVLDKSPSMNWTIPSSADIRWNRLKTSAQLFASVWDSIGAPPFPGTVSSEGHPDDRLGLVFFGGTAVESPLDGASFFKQRGVSAAPWGAAVSAALVDTFIGGTSIGAGITNARSRLNGVGLLTGDTAIVLFTDGEQNTPPCITHTGETLSPTFKAYPGEPPGTTYLDQCTVAASAGATASLRLNGSVLASDVLPIGPIFTIGLGQGGVADAAKLLNEISDETAGRARFPNDGLAMDTSFLDQLVDNLKGSTVSLLERVTTEVPAGASAGGPMQVRADPSLTRMTFVLSWVRMDRDIFIARISMRSPGLRRCSRVPIASLRFVIRRVPVC